MQVQCKELRMEKGGLLPLPSICLATKVDRGMHGGTPPSAASRRPPLPFNLNARGVRAHLRCGRLSHPPRPARRRTHNMPSKMLIDAAHPEETRVVVVKGTRVEEFSTNQRTRSNSGAISISPR